MQLHNADGYPLAQAFHNTTILTPTWIDIIKLPVACTILRTSLAYTVMGIDEPTHTHTDSTHTHTHTLSLTHQDPYTQHTHTHKDSTHTHTAIITQQDTMHPTPTHTHTCKRTTHMCIATAELLHFYEARQERCPDSSLWIQGNEMSTSPDIGQLSMLMPWNLQ